MCLDRSCRCGFLTRASAPWLSPLICATYGCFPIYLGKPMSFRTCTIHWLCFAHDDIAIYSDSVLEVATEVCFLLPHEIGPLYRIPTCPDVLLRSVLSPAQSASKYS